MKINKWSWVFLVLIICDIVYTFFQNYLSMYLDGDIIAIISPSESYKKVLTDPFGFGVLFRNEYYAASNRFFIHWFMGLYFRSVPFIFQLFTDPINSIFLSLAFGRTLTQVLIIYLIASIASNTGKILNKDFLIAALIVTPFFQIDGYWYQMSVTHSSITYTFFYSLPFVFLLLYFLPFFKFLFYNMEFKFHWLIHLLILADALVISFGGPLSPPVIIIVCPLILTYLFIRNYNRLYKSGAGNKFVAAIKQIPNPVFYHFLFITIICIYSIYVGTHNAENFDYKLSIRDRYQLLPYGFWVLFSLKLGPPLLFGMCVFNSILIYRKKNEMASKMVIVSCFAVLSCIIYLLLLPLGGYRGYRPLIVRCDTFSPVTVSLIFIYALTTIYLLNHFTGKAKGFFIGLIALIIVIYTNADRFKDRTNTCEIESFKQLAASPDSIVHLTGPCNLMSWARFTNYRDSELSGQMMQYWHITKDKKYYYY